jgi:tetratricopeptide (TPR) repeat protein
MVSPRLRSIVLTSLLVGGVAYADPTGRARAHYDKGSAYFDISHFRDAAREYEEAYTLKPDPALLFNMAQAYRLAGDLQRALLSYRSYLRRDPNARNRTEAEAHIAQEEQRMREQTDAVAPPSKPSLPPTETKPEMALTTAQATPPTQPPATVVLAPMSMRPLPARTSMHKKWWVWTIVGGVVAAAAAAGVGIAVTTPKDAPAPLGSIPLSFH